MIATLKSSSTHNKAQAGRGLDRQASKLAEWAAGVYYMLPASLKLFAAEPQTSKGKYISGWVRTLNLNGPVFICLFVFVRSGVPAI